MRLYATLRFYQLALLLDMTGGVVTALIAASARANHVALTMLKAPRGTRLSWRQAFHAPYLAIQAREATLCWTNGSPRAECHLKRD